MKTELLRALSFGSFNQEQVQATTRKTQEANRVVESLQKAGGTERAQMTDVYVRTAKEAVDAQGNRFQARSQQVKQESLQFARVLTQGSIETNKKFAALIAFPMDGAQPAVQIGRMLDVYA